MAVLCQKCQPAVPPPIVVLSSWMFHSTVHLYLLTVLTVISGHCSAQTTWPSSTVQKQNGHYPGNMCIITNAFLNLTGATFHYKSNEDLHSDKCPLCSKVWEINHTPRMEEVECNEFYDVGYVHTVYYYLAKSNYYHLHWDLLLPLYKDVYYSEEGSHEEDHVQVQEKRSLVFMPSVEASRLQKIDWNTPAFDDVNHYWVQLSKFLAEGHSFRPLVRHLLKEGGNICFRTVKFGTARYDFKEPALINSYVKYVKQRFGITQSLQTKERVGIISRPNRRRILNEQELVDAVGHLADTKLVSFDGLTFQQQVENMEEFTVLLGVNGAGLINCIYLPDNGVCVQLVPFNCTGRLNFNQYGGLLAARGPYLIWHNTHPELHHERRPGDNAQADTVVHVEEFVELVKKALQMSRDFLAADHHPLQRHSRPDKVEL